MNTNISNIFLEQLSWLYAIFFSLSKTRKENRKWDNIFFFLKKKHNPKSRNTQALEEYLLKYAPFWQFSYF